MFGKNNKNNKVKPVPPTMPRQITVHRSPWKKSLKWLLIFILGIGLGVGAWILFSANSAVRKITTDGSQKSSLFSFLGDGSKLLKGQSDGRTNILLLGMGGSNHPGGTLSDTMIVVSINHKDKKVALLSIPRDLWVPIPGYNHAKINEAYSKGESDKKTTGGGGVLASKVVENVTGLPIHYYIRLDFEGFKKIIDMVGGVDVYVEKDLSDPYYPADNMIDYSPFKITAGTHHLDGAMALKYARSRETTSDFDRSRRQQQVMAALKEKLFSLNILANPKKITDLFNILGDHLRTNMQVDEIMAFWNVGKTLDTANMNSKVLDTAADGPLTASQDYRGYYIYPKKGIDKFEDIQKIAKNMFNEALAEMSVAKIEVSNGTSQRGTASTVSEFLSSYGYNVTKTDDAQGAYPKTVVYDYSGGKYAKIAQDIAAKLNSQVEIKNTLRSGVDIQVIVGQDYLR